MQEYDGGRTSSDIVNWSLEKLAENVPAPEVMQIANEKSLREACEDKPLCVVSVLPHILDCQSDCRNQYLKTLNDLGKKFKQKMWGYVQMLNLEAKGACRHKAPELGGPREKLEKKNTILKARKN